MTRYAPVGLCIYCGADAPSLSDEHIIPFSLNGKLLLPKASCKSCAQITSAFELTVSRKIYGPFRVKQGFATRHSKKRPTSLKVFHGDDPSRLQLSQIPVTLYPTYYIAVKLSVPGILTGAPLTEMNPPMEIQLKGAESEILVAMRALGSKHFSIASDFPWTSFCRMLAKIAHAYLVAEIGTEGYIALLPDLILGRNNNLSHYVGGVGADEHVGINNSELMLRLVGSKDGLFFLVAYIQLLGQGRLPIYQVVAGRVTDLDRFYSMTTRQHATSRNSPQS